MGRANILTGIAVLIWGGLLLVGRDLISGVVAQKALGYPNTAQIDFLIAWPAAVGMALLLTAWICNGLRRWAAPLALLSGAALVALLPYLFVYGGGV
jgi:hypothetical protein